MVVDRPARTRIEREPELGEAGIEDGGVRGRQVGEALDARRERISLAAQVPLLWTYPLPPGRPAPGVVVCAHHGCGSVFPRSSGSWPGFPVPLASLVTLVQGPWCGCRTLRRLPPGVNAVIHESTIGLPFCG